MYKIHTYWLFLLWVLVQMIHLNQLLEIKRSDCIVLVLFIMDAHSYRNRLSIVFKREYDIKRISTIVYTQSCKELNFIQFHHWL